METLDRPIFIVGAARSGTSLLGNLLARHSSIAYWVEPKYIWRYRRPTAGDDVRTADEATPPVKQYIRSAFARYVAERDGTRFMDKTPSNCFRISFMQEIFPEARFLHIVRDGRDVAFSARRKWRTPPKKEALWRRLTSWEIPLRDAPFYAIDFVRDVLGRQFMPERGFTWGPQFPGIHDVRRTHSLLKTCAIQWRESVRAAREGLGSLPPSDKIEVRFEDLVAQPRKTMNGLLDSLELDDSGRLASQAAEIVNPEAAGRWESRDDGTLNQIQPLMQDELDMLGYVASQ